jgi:hypothetical protein
MFATPGAKSKTNTTRRVSGAAAVLMLLSFYGTVRRCGPRSSSSAPSGGACVWRHFGSTIADFCTLTTRSYGVMAQRPRGSPELVGLPLVCAAVDMVSDLRGRLFRARAWAVQRARRIEDAYCHGPRLPPGRGVRRPARRSVPRWARKRGRAELTVSRYVVAFAYCSALMTSMPTNGSPPSTQASWPGGIVYDSPALMLFSVPSSRRTLIRPETAYPTCEF